MRASGVLGRLHFRAKQAADRTDIVLAHNQPGYVPTTDVTYLESSVLEGAPKKLGAIAGISVRVYPPLPGEQAQTSANEDLSLAPGPKRPAGRGVSLTESGLSKNRQF